MRTNLQDAEKAGPKGYKVECFLKRDKINSVFYLYQEDPPNFVQDKGQLLLAAKQSDSEDTNTKFIISHSADDFSEESPFYVGEVLRSNYVGTKFVVNARHPFSAIKTAASAESSHRPPVGIKQVSPAIPPSFKSLPTHAPPLTALRVAHEFNFFCINVCGAELFPPRLLKSLQTTSPSTPTPQKDAKQSTTHNLKTSLSDISLLPPKHTTSGEHILAGISDSQPQPNTSKQLYLNKAAQIVYQANYYGLCNFQRDFYGRRLPKQMECILFSCGSQGSRLPRGSSNLKTPKTVRFKEDIEAIESWALPSTTGKNPTSTPIILKTKPPKWLEKHQCLSLLFHGRATIQSIKNFQLVVVEPARAGAEMEQVVLQFGKVGKHKFNVDYCYPLSPFLAFSICLSTFST